MKYFIVLLFLPLITFAHPGRTDLSGGHYCRTNCLEKWGLEYNEYHLHNYVKETVKKAKIKSKTKSR